MAWLELIVDTRAEHGDTVAEVLDELGAQAVTLADAGNTPLLEPGPGETPLWPQTRVTGLFSDDIDRHAITDALTTRLGNIVESVRFEVLEDRPWERAWLDDFAPLQFGEHLWICPSGMRAPDPAAVVIELDPGLAFGTGTHPTTALCLEWLDQAELAGAHVLDYGCGSGVLAIAAARLGAETVQGTDIDPQAIIATRDNAARNGVGERIALIDTDALDPGGYDVVVANILAGPLQELAPTLTRATRPGGQLVLSGILAAQADAVRAAYAAAFERFACTERDGWVRLEALRR